MTDADYQGPLQVTLVQLLRAMIERGASDLHLTKGTPPQFRIDGSLVPLKMPPLRPEDTKQLVYSAISDDQNDDQRYAWRGGPLVFDVGQLVDQIAEQSTDDDGNDNEQNGGLPGGYFRV